MLVTLRTSHGYPMFCPSKCQFPPRSCPPQTQQCDRLQDGSPRPPLAFCVGDSLNLTWLPSVLHCQIPISPWILHPPPQQTALVNCLNKRYCVTSKHQSIGEGRRLFLRLHASVNLVGGVSLAAPLGRGSMLAPPSPNPLPTHQFCGILSSHHLKVSFLLKN